MKIDFFNGISNRPLYSRYEYPMKKYAPKGCSQDQIQTLQKRCKVHLPKAYEEYLFLMGIDHQLYDSGIGYCYAELEDMQDQAQLLLSEEGFEIAKNFWVIDILYNDQFHFFYLNDGEDPSVYHWVGRDQEHIEGYENGIKRVDKKFSSYIMDMVPSRVERFVGGLVSWYYKVKP